MSMKISASELKRSHERLQSIRHRLGSLKAKAQESTERLVHTAESCLAAFASGMIQGKTGGGVEVMGIPLDLGLGVLLEAAGHFNVAGRASDHLIGFGDGFLNAYFVTVGRGVGQAWAERSGGSTGTPQVPAGQSQGQIPAAAKGVGLSPHDIAAAAMAAQMGNQ